MEKEIGIDKEKIIDAGFDIIKILEKYRCSYMETMIILDNLENAVNLSAKVEFLNEKKRMDK